jgi:hypothetical protein
MPIHGPDGGIPALLLAVAAKLRYVVIARDSSGAELGEFRTECGAPRPLLLTGTEPGCAAWILNEGSEAPGLAPHLFARDAAAALQGGSLDTVDR